MNARADEGRSLMTTAEKKTPSRPKGSDVEVAYRQHRPWLVRFLAHRFGSAISEDLVQEAFARTLKAGTEVRNPRAFLVKVAIRAAREAARRHPQPIDIQTLFPAFEAPSGNEAAVLEQAILRLPKPLREVFLLSRFGGLSNVEIAHRCNLSVKRVEARITKARQMCTALIGD
jgi:RNA polymerase sigma factor (sigma-70 family)